MLMSTTRIQAQIPFSCNVVKQLLNLMLSLFRIFANGKEVCRMHDPNFMAVMNRDDLDEDISEDNMDLWERGP